MGGYNFHLQTDFDSEYCMMVMYITISTLNIIAMILFR